MPSGVGSVLGWPKLIHEIAILQGESELRKAPMANAHLANGIAKSEAVLKLYLRYDAQLERFLQDSRPRRTARVTPKFPGAP